MEEAVPGASVFPTLTRPGATQTGNAGGVGRTPTPLSVTVVGELVASLVAVTLPVRIPVTTGAKAAFSVAVCPGARIVPAGTPLAMKPAPETLTFEIVTLELPVFLSVTPRMLLVPESKFPKLKLVALTLSRWVAGFTVSVAALLVTLPAELLTTTVNCSPVSDVLVAGVV